LAVSYDPAKLAPGTDVSKLNLYYYDGTAWRATLPCQGCSLDTVNHTITVLLDHLTTFAVMAPGAAPSTSPTGSGGASNGTSGGSADAGNGGAGTAGGSTSGVTGGGGPTGGGGGGRSSSPVSARAVKLDYSALRRLHRLGVTVANANSYRVRVSAALHASYVVRKAGGHRVTRQLVLGSTAARVGRASQTSIDIVLARQKIVQLLAGRAQAFFLVLTTSAPSRPAAVHRIRIALPVARLRG
jgi:hypothetical protein